MAEYAIITFGCQMNQHDSERIGEVLRGAGHLPAATPESAKIIVVNTCSVRAKAEQKLRSELGRLALLKRQRPEIVICVAGCVAQQEGERLLAQVAEVDLVIGPDNIPELAALLADVQSGSPPRARTVFDLQAPHFLAAQPRAGDQAPCAYVTIMKGCDERCSFCVVPQLRGPERYRPSREILDEVARLVDAGVREITLLGQTVNSYHDPLGELPPAAGAGGSPWLHTSSARAQADESEFAALVRAIAERVSELARLRYTAPHPRRLTASLIRAHQEVEMLARHVHLPVQSGSDRVLRRMVRRHSVAEYLERTQALRDAAAGITLSTDIIVGFAGESRSDFEATLKLVADVGFVGLFGFKYSPRPNTAALKLTDDVREAEKSQRLAELFALSNSLRQAHLASLVGTVQKVLVEGLGDEARYTGRTERNEIVHFDCRDDPTGEILELRIIEPYKNSLAAEPVDPARAVPRPASAAAGSLLQQERETSRRSLKVM